MPGEIQSHQYLVTFLIVILKLNQSIMISQCYSFVIIISEEK